MPQVALTIWKQSGTFEYEYKPNGEPTGRHRSIHGKRQDGTWPAWNNQGQMMMTA